MARTKKAGTRTHGGSRLSVTRRVVHLIQLFEGGEKIYKQELMRAFGVDAKTIQRDICALIEFYPIRKEREGNFVFYQLKEGGKKK